MKINNRHNFLFIPLLFLYYNGCVFADENLSAIPIIHAYEKNDIPVQIPFSMNSTSSEITPKIETTLSEDIKKQNLLSSKSETLVTNANDTSFKAFLNKKKFLKENKSEPSLWQGASLVIGFLSLIGILAYIMTKINRKGLFKNIKNEKAMNIISSLSINPKRQIMLLQIRDKEIVVSNTESGINFLADVGNSLAYKEAPAIPIEKKPFQIANFIKSTQNSTAIPENKPRETEKNLSLSEKKSDILVKALKRMEKKPESEKIDKNLEKNVPINEDVAKFPKYFSNIFENEAKREIPKKEEPDSVENVTNLIREKLRSMKPLN